MRCFGKKSQSFLCKVVLLDEQELIQEIQIINWIINKMFGDATTLEYYNIYPQVQARVVGRCGVALNKTLMPYKALFRLDISSHLRFPLRSIQRGASLIVMPPLRFEQTCKQALTEMSVLHLLDRDDHSGYYRPTCRHKQIT
ncbi:hypothetical protein B566_EDAN000729 [Ephemera danica]|nr:hypothetical protein B566_EDAN000729 [Ephemera danica]